MDPERWRKVETIFARALDAGSSRLSVVALVIFFIGGGLILLRVDEKEGRARASS